MSDFMFLFRGGDSRTEYTPEEMQAHMQKWSVWMKDLGQKGLLIAGQPLEQDGHVVTDHGAVITDGPFSEGKEIVGGYLIVKADNLEGAVELSKACPIFEHGGSVEVRGIAELNL